MLPVAGPARTCVFVFIVMSLYDHCTNFDVCGPALIPLFVLISYVSFTSSAERCANAQNLLCWLVGRGGRVVLIVK